MHRILAIAATAAGLAGCSVSTTHQAGRIELSGAPEQVDRFVAAEMARAPQLAAWRQAGAGRATLMLPRSADGRYVVALGERAMKSRLSFSYVGPTASATAKLTLGG